MKLINTITKFIIILLLIVLISDNIYSQGWKRYRRELSVSLGATNFLGDLGGANIIGTHGILDFDFPSVRPAMNLGYSFKISQRLTLKSCFTYGQLYGNDAYTKEKFRNHRNLMFRSPILQLHSQLEFYIIREREGHKYNIQGVRGWQNIKISAYLFAGVGGFYFNPKAKYPVDGKWYALRKLHTEGQGYIPEGATKSTRPMYSQIQPSIPVGIGFKYALSKNLSLGIEYSLYKTFTDYIDDVSSSYFDPNWIEDNYGKVARHLANPHKPDYGGINWKTTAAGQQRGNARVMDAYMFAMVSLYYTMPSGRFVIPLF